MLIKFPEAFHELIDRNDHSYQGNMLAQVWSRAGLLSEGLELNVVDGKTH